MSTITRRIINIIGLLITQERCLRGENILQILQDEGIPEKEVREAISAGIDRNWFLFRKNWSIEINPLIGKPA
jgi:hypothetical protein